MRVLMVPRLRRLALFLLSLLLMCGAPLAQACDTFDDASRTLTIPLITVGGTRYTQVVITVARVYSFTGTITNPSSVVLADYYDPVSGHLIIPCVTVGGIIYTNVVIDVGSVVSVGPSSSPSPNTPTLIPVIPLRDATVGQTPAYTQSVVFEVFPPSPPSLYTYSIDTLASGNGVPSGMTLNMNGVLSGTPFATGAADVNGNQVQHAYTFGVCATDTLSRTTTTPCPQTTINVVPANITVTLAGTGSGTVSPSRAGNSCGANCYSGFASGSSVTLTATPASGSTFTGWSGACSGTGSCVLTVNGSMAVTATFTARPTCSNGGTDYPICTPPISNISPTAVQLGAIGGCSGGKLTTTFQVTAASNVSWTAAGDAPAVGGGSTVVLSPKSGTGPGTITVTITVPPQKPSSSYSNCSLTYNLGTFSNIFVTFSDGNSVGVTVYWTFIGVT